MKRLLILAGMAVALAACGSTSAYPSNTDSPSLGTSAQALLTEPVCVPLIAGQNDDAGQVCIWSDGVTLFVEYTVAPSYSMSEAHVWVSTTKDFPLNNGGNVQPGQFDKFPNGTAATFALGTNSYKAEIPLANIPGDPGCGSEIYVLAHANLGVETAWAQGPAVGSKNWATYVDTEIPCDMCVVNHVDCGPYGQCQPATGECVCEPTYTGDNCSECEGGYSRVDNGGSFACVPACTGGDTAYAFGGDNSTCFIDANIGNSNNWGWTNLVTSSDTNLTMDLWAGAGQCVLDKGTLVGTVLVKRVGSEIVISATAKAGDGLASLDVYYGPDLAPKNGSGAYTSAPGQYPCHIGPNDACSFPALDGDGYVIVHAQACY
ncbi:MAG: hypothetical protein FWD69_18220 [Polyangiaceae bacterium]|nr:hypothetical protein [Polyangiaceae bacterium]